jgi:uncharacterized protein YlxP (DUF503 family)
MSFDETSQRLKAKEILRFVLNRLRNKNDVASAKFVFSEMTDHAVLAIVTSKEPDHFIK